MSDCFAIRKFSFNPQMFEHPRRIIIALLFLDTRFRSQKHAHVRGIHVVIFVAVKRFPRGDELWILRPARDRWIGRFKRRTGKRMIFIVRHSVQRQSRRMRMVVNRADAANSGEERRIRFLRRSERCHEYKEDKEFPQHQVLGPFFAFAESVEFAHRSSLLCANAPDGDCSLKVIFAANR